MQGVRIKITGPDGRSWTVPFTGAQLRFGRTADNEVVLENGSVSSSHCVIGRDPSGAFVVRDQGSTNGTWLGDHRVQGTVQLPPGASLMVGNYMVVLEAGRAPDAPRPLTGAAPIVSAPIRGTRGPLIRQSKDERETRRIKDRVRRYADEWDKAGRPSRLLLRARNLRAALDLLDLAGDADEVFGELEESFVRASAEGRERGKVLRIVGIAVGALAAVGLIAFLALRDWGGDEAELVLEAGSGSSDTGESEQVTVVEGNAADTVAVRARQIVKHVVIPAETLEEIALRYDVSTKIVALKNGVDENAPLEPGTVLEVSTDKDPLPLPQQELTYETDKTESWSSLAKRFDVPVAKLQAYNEGVEGNIRSGTRLTIWIDPKPLQRRADVQLPEFTVRQDAISVGKPTSGKIINPIQFPENEQLYRRRNPQIMWCASPMAEHLQWAVAKFRYTYDFEGEIVIADMSKKTGGLFNPHKSHQAGRDVDIWLPSLKGVYQQSHLREGKDRRPFPEEADWFALYGFVKALGETKAVESVFLDKALHDRVYNAALLMGADEAELDEMIMFHPDGGRFPHALLKHAADHFRHVHVRFKCGPNDECSKSYDQGPGD